LWLVNKRNKNIYRTSLMWTYRGMNEFQNWLQWGQRRNNRVLQIRTERHNNYHSCNDRHKTGNAQLMSSTDAHRCIAIDFHTLWLILIAQNRVGCNTKHLSIAPSAHFTCFGTLTKSMTPQKSKLNCWNDNRSTFLVSTIVSLEPAAMKSGSLYKITSWKCKRKVL